MAFWVQKCGNDCPQLLYVLAEPGDQKIYCGSCGGVTVYRLRSTNQDDGMEDVEA